MNFRAIKNLPNTIAQQTSNAAYQAQLPVIKHLQSKKARLPNRSVNLFLLLLLLAPLIAAAQQPNYEHTNNKPDQTLRSNARINPSTLAMELSIPIADLPGRAGAAMPLVFNYSSKVWNLRPAGIQHGVTQRQEEVRPEYSYESSAGWTSSYDVPVIDSAVEGYTCYGAATDELYNLPADCYGNYTYVKKLRVKMPGGTMHELRKDDLVYTSTNVLEDRTGVYLAVDGTRVRLEWGTGGTATLFMPDGGRYFFDASQRCYRYIDRHGNVLEYDQTTAAWTDTLGRSLAAPRRANPVEETHNYVVPSLGTTNRQFQFVWKKVSDGALNFGEVPAYVTQNCSINGNPRSPLLFTYTTEIKPCHHESAYFDPIVLKEIILPNGQKYQFKYTSYGEIARIDYPNGAYERFVYGTIKGIGWDYQLNSGSANSYGQANRGVIDRYLGGDGIAAEQHWHYAADYETTATYGSYTYIVTTTNPDQTVEKRFLHRTRRPQVTTLPIGNNGFDTILAGREMETQTLDANGAMRTRTLIEWETTNAPAAGYANSIPQRDARQKRQINIILEPGNNNALATMTENVYETPGQNGVPSDPAYFAALNTKRTNNYHFKVVGASNGSAAPFAEAVMWFSVSDIASVSETDYLYDANYQTRNINGLVSETRLKDAAGNTRAKSQIVYDQTNYLETASVTNAPGWENPNTNYRGLATTSRSWYDVAANQYIETHASYDQFGNPRKSWDGRGNYSEIQYADNYTDSVNRNSYALPTKTISHAGAGGTGTVFETSVKYDFDTGLPVSTADANNLETHIEYADPMLRPTKAQQYFNNLPVGAATETIYGAGTTAATRFVKVRAQIDETKWKEGYTWFDGLGRTVKTQSVDSNGDVFALTCYDQYGRPSKVSNPFRNVSNPTCSSNLEWTTNTYDAAGRVWKVTTPDNAVVETNYTLATAGNNIGTAVTVKDQALKERRSITNALGQLTRVDEPDIDNSNLLGSISAPNQPTYYEYDALNNLAKVKQGGTLTNPQQTRTFVYDSLSRLKSATNPELGNTVGGTHVPGTINYAYDDNGNLTQKTDPRGVVTTYVYDALNRATSRSYANEPSGQAATPTVTYTYDAVTNAKGKLTKVSSTVSETSYTAFDVMGRVTASEQRTPFDTETVAAATPRTSGYVYNLSGALVEQTYPSGRVVKNVLDAEGDLSIVQSKKNANSGYWNYAHHFSYTAAGAVSSMQLGNGRWESTEFNSRLQPVQIALGAIQNGTDKLKLNFNYGQAQNNGNVLSQTITIPAVGPEPSRTFTQNYTYDSLNRLKQADEKPLGYTQTQCDQNPAQCWKQTFLYDRYGNRNFDMANTTAPSSQGTSAKVVNPEVLPSNNRFKQDQDADGIADYLYDAAGNTTKDALGKQFTYDAESKQTEVKNASSQSLGTYLYDGDGKRVKKVAGNEVTIFIYDAAGKLVAEYANQILVPSEAKVSYLTADHLGSPRINTDANGAVTARHDYHPFGEEIVRSSYGYDKMRKQFTAYERDNESDLDFAQARYYKPSHGRFTSPDEPFADQFESNPQSWSLYAYARNNPLNLIDPFGMAAGCPPAYPDCYERDGSYYIKDAAGVESLVEDEPPTLTETKVKGDQATEITTLLTGRRGRSFTNLERNLRHLGNWLRNFFSSNRNPNPRPAPAPKPNEVYGPPAPPDPPVSPSVPPYVLNILNQIKNLGGRALTGYRGGRTFRNDGRGGGQTLPNTDNAGNPIQYKEYDVHPYQRGVNRGAERIVRGSDGSSYYTNNHYNTFIKIE